MSLTRTKVRAISQVLIFMNRRCLLTQNVPTLKTVSLTENLQTIRKIQCRNTTQFKPRATEINPTNCLVKTPNSPIKYVRNT